MTDSGLMPGILSGLRIVEGSAFVAAPLGGLTLAQLGADVIRFDQIGGGPDFTRWPVAADGQSLFWAGLNKNKRSVQVDLASPRGREIVRQLIAAPGEGGGIFLTNFPARGWLGYERARRRAARPDHGRGHRQPGRVFRARLHGQRGRGLAGGDRPARRGRAGQQRVPGLGRAYRPVRSRWPSWPPSGTAGSPAGTAGRAGPVRRGAGHDREPGPHRPGPARRPGAAGRQLPVRRVRRSTSRPATAGGS